MQKHDGMVSYASVNIGHGSVISVGILRELAQTEFKHLMPRLPIARVGEIVGHFGK
ncbi:hypothetical protein [Acidisoma sp. S159]|uniref:hypothetical protein n=1 Tax=Acidisoma sp. S159 TaxID=1747225 RepID=UPI00131BA372|nr:hypothetical protein [Acidisoma sp. S159]